MLSLQGSICHGQVMNSFLKPNTGGQFDYVGINIIVEHILSGMRIISKEYYFGDMVLQLRFSFSRVSHIDTISKISKGGEVLLLGCSFLNRKIN